MFHAQPGRSFLIVQLGREEKENRTSEPERKKEGRERHQEAEAERDVKYDFGGNSFALFESLISHVGWDELP